VANNAPPIHAPNLLIDESIGAVNFTLEIFLKLPAISECNLRGKPYK